jgi:hypothetical protein
MKKRKAIVEVPSVPESYRAFLTELKQRIQAAQLRASLSVNRELVLLYWQIGRDILDRQDRERWGAKVIDRLSVDLKRTFPDGRILAAQPEVHARLCGSLAGEGNCATACCTNSVGTQRSHPGPR